MQLKGVAQDRHVERGYRGAFGTHVHLLARNLIELVADFMV